MRSSIILFLSLLSVQLIAQNKPLFEGSEKLDQCLVDLPLDYATKNEERLHQAAKKLENSELIYLAFDKKSGVSYQRVFVVTESVKGSTYVFLLSPEDHAKTGGTKRAMFVGYKPKKHRFYNAACFDQVVASDPELESRLKKL